MEFSFCRGVGEARHLRMENLQHRGSYSSPGEAANGMPEALDYAIAKVRQYQIY